MEKPYVVGIDIGGQTAKLGLVDARGNVLVQTVIKSNDTDNYGRRTLQKVSQVTHHLRKTILAVLCQKRTAKNPQGDSYHHSHTEHNNIIGIHK